ncbi:hypothetical protein [Flavobacterium sp. GP15]|uniref:hypothetical protein n=1 Tax=Flavobacterium sp. GP15 TaxID=2758567 RepID=UPI00165E67CE|nr:hypothetical protein [Flavobacterium sp. GP15]
MLKSICQYFRKKDEIIGIWTREDDGSGLINIYGWSLHFFENGTGKSYSWENDSETNYDFEWKRENKTEIKLRTEVNDWEFITYKMEKYIGAYKSKQTKLTEINKDKFWDFPEALYKCR